jgi:hypothetical protein
MKLTQVFTFISLLVATSALPMIDESAKAGGSNQSDVTDIPSNPSSMLNLPFIEGTGKEILSPEFKGEKFVGLEQTQVDGNSLIVTYPKGSFKTPKTGGFQFISKPVVEAEEMTLTYSIYIPADFDFVKGYVLFSINRQR